MSSLSRTALVHSQEARPHSSYTPPPALSRREKSTYMYLASVEWRLPEPLHKGVDIFLICLCACIYGIARWRTRDVLGFNTQPHTANIYSSKYQDVSYQIVDARIYLVHGDGRLPTVVAQSRTLHIGQYACFTSPSIFAVQVTTVRL